MTKEHKKRENFSPTDRSNIRWFWENYFKDKAPRLVLIFILAASQGLVYQQFLQLTDNGLRIIFTNGEYRDLLWVCLAVFLVFMYRGIMSFVIPRLAALVTTDAVMRMRSDLINHVMNLDLAFFERSTPGDFVLRLVQQTQALSDFIGQATVRAVRDIFTIVIVSIYLIIKQPTLFLAAAIAIPFILLGLRLVSHRSKIVQKDVQQANSDYIDTIEEVVSSVRTVKISNQVDHEKSRLQVGTQSLSRLNLRLLTTNAAAQPFVDFAAAFVYMLVIGVGGYFALSPNFNVDGAEIITFLLGLILIFDPGRRLAEFWVKLQSSLVILDGVRSLHRETASITSAPDALTAFDVSGDITLNAVSFAYDNDTPILSDLSLTLAGGKTTAIVGTTGSGKTTVLSLIGRLYDATSGAIEIGGTPIKDINISSLRSTFSVVAQDTIIFNASIRENILYVRPDATNAELADAAKSAEIYDLMLERGDEPLGTKGAHLSGGQRQRIAIARAFLSAAPIVMLDEATSALDQKTETKVTAALKRLSKGRTTVMVAHRLSSVVHADCIIVLDNGKLVEQGTHAELMKAKGLYQTLFDTQKNNFSSQ